MNWWTVEPRDPLLVRDGRPFGLGTDGARSLDFPTPSAVAGTLRSWVGFALGGGRRFALDPVRARAISVRGPLLVELSGARSPWLHAPRDCVLFDADPSGWDRHRLHPVARWSDGASSLPEPLLPIVGVEPLPRAKPAKRPPAFWDLGTLRAWLEAPPNRDRLDPDRGLPALPHEVRIHVAIDPATGTGADGKLFQTDGLRLTFEQPDGTIRRLGFLVGCSSADVGPGMVTLGGERRLSRLEPASDELRRVVEGWAAPGLAARRARVVLLTPALFRDGAVPSRIGGARVVAAAVGRPQVISGWDLAYKLPNGRRGAPKPTRRCAGAGSVYWVELPEDTDAEAWARAVHLQCVSDDEQDRLDGFGLAAVGVWG